MKSVKRLALICVMVISCCMMSAAPVSAETLLDRTQLYDGSALIDGDYAEDSVSILTRGNHLSNGVSSIQDKGSRVVAVGGTTTCHRTCDTVICNLYLEQLDDNGDWYTYKYWQCSTTNAYTYSPSRSVSVEGDHWYRVRAAHSAILNGVTESVGTATDGIWID